MPGNALESGGVNHWVDGFHKHFDRMLRQLFCPVNDFYGKNERAHGRGFLHQANEANEEFCRPPSAMASRGWRIKVQSFSVRQDVHVQVCRPSFPSVNICEPLIPLYRRPLGQLHESLWQRLRRRCLPLPRQTYRTCHFPVRPPRRR